MEVSFKDGFKTAGFMGMPKGSEAMGEGL